MRAILRSDRADDELATALARAGLYVERIAAGRDARGRLFSTDVAVVDPRLLGAPEAVTPRADGAAAGPPAARAADDRPLEEVCYTRLTTFFDRLGDARLPHLHATVLEGAERALLRVALERTPNLGAAAQRLGVHRNTLARRLEELGLRQREVRQRPRRRRSR